MCTRMKKENIVPLILYFFLVILGVELGNAPFSSNYVKDIVLRN